MSHEVKLLLASAPMTGGPTVYTFRLRYWRAIHGEVMTHRALNRNAGSSRAIPVKKMLDMVMNDTAGPVHWGANQSGMQADRENDELVVLQAYMGEPLRKFLQRYEGLHFAIANVDGTFSLPKGLAWEFSAFLMAEMSWAYSAAGYHKQVANRLTEPFQYINVIVTATEWRNFDALRCHPDAMPEFRMLAEDMRECRDKAEVQVLNQGEWHIPYLSDEEKSLPLETKLKLSSARCAAVSYQTVDGQPMTLTKAEAVFEKLMGTPPLHASPTEHQAQCGEYVTAALHSSLAPPWRQYRKFIEAGVPVAWGTR